MRYPMLHEAPELGEDLAQKYNVKTYEEYKAWSRANKGSPVSEFSGHYNCIQRIVKTIIFMQHIAGHKPRYVVINNAFAARLIEEEGEIPTEVEGVKLAYDAKAIFETTSIL